MSCPKSTRFLISMAAVALLVVSAVVNGASVAVDSKTVEPTQSDNAQTNADAVQAKKLDVGESVAEEHASTDPRIGLYSQQVINPDSVGPIGANKAFYLTTSDGYGQPAGGYQSSYGASMPAPTNYMMGPLPSNQYQQYVGYQMAPAYQQASPAPAQVYTGSGYGAIFNNPPPTHNTAYAPSYPASYTSSYTTPPPPTTVAPPYPPPTTVTPPAPQSYTEATVNQPVAPQQPYNVFTPFTFTSGYGVNTGYNMVPSYGGVAAPVSPPSYGAGSYSAQVPQSYSSYGAPVTQVPYSSPLSGYTPMQQTSFGLPMSAVPYGVDMNRVPEAYVSTGMGGYASYGAVNAGPIMAPMSTYPTMTSFVPLSSGSSAPTMAAYPTTGGY